MLATDPHRLGDHRAPRRSAHELPGVLHRRRPGQKHHARTRGLRVWVQRPGNRFLRRLDAHGRRLEVELHIVGRWVRPRRRWVLGGRRRRPRHLFGRAAATSARDQLRADGAGRRWRSVGGGAPVLTHVQGRFLRRSWRRGERVHRPERRPPLPGGLHAEDPRRERSQRRLQRMPLLQPSFGQVLRNSQLQRRQQVWSHGLDDARERGMQRRPVGRLSVWLRLGNDHVAERALLQLAAFGSWRECGPNGGQDGLLPVAGASVLTPRCSSFCSRESQVDTLAELTSLVLL